MTMLEDAHTADAVGPLLERGVRRPVEYRTVAALYVEPKGCYVGVPGVDPWDEARDARKYAGPWPVVAHPPCNRWCMLAPVNQARYGQKVGDDGGCFAAALHAVRTWGGVLEHPALTLAWNAHELPRPASGGGWTKTMCGGWTCEVEQRHYGHKARKATWLYAHGMVPPSLKWGKGPAPEAWISSDRPRAELAARGIAQLQRKESRATPPAFRDLLLSIARQAHNERICEASGLDVALFRDAPEDNLSALLVAWYTEHLARGGAPDAVQEQILAEVEAEDTLGAHRVQIGSGRPQ